ncbi:contact-dependent growth inhibition system immunity protein [Streptomyces sp. NPDC002250]|uniref:contact-dependent growth inhibition system immunity protein n=1 Tax=Streptomyces sp. NPDC002250 TaxID=3364641 RepID=UPI0036C9A702
MTLAAAWSTAKRSAGIPGRALRLVEGCESAKPRSEVLGQAVCATAALDRDRSLAELERDCWPEPSAGATRLAAAAHALRRRPIGELTVEDVRLLIGQDIGLPYLLPLAVEVLRENPMAEGHMYEGDLLSAVLTRDLSVWAEFPALVRELRGIVSKLTGLPPDLERKVDRFLVP